MDKCDRDWFSSALIFITLIIVTTILLVTFAHLIGQDGKAPPPLTRNFGQNITHK